MRTCTLAVTAMGKTTYIYLSQGANPFQHESTLSTYVRQRTTRTNIFTITLD